MSREAYDYTVALDYVDQDTHCTCDDCGSGWPFSALAEIDHAVLTPGQPSPAGRCPECGTLAYVTGTEPEA